MLSQPDRDAELFSLLISRGAADRDRILDVLCGEDVALRGRLKALLAAQPEVITTVVDGGDPAQPTVQAEISPRQIEEAVGQTLGRYKLLEKIGEGGCGAVYAAEQIEPVHRHVAVKVIKYGMDTKSVVARFEAERQALARMDHPNIAKVLDAGTTEQGRPYFVMELVRGIPINTYCDQARLSINGRLDLFIKVCHAIQHAHQKGIIHRDIKPSNILVTLREGAPVPKVIDFGIAKATEGRLTDATVHTLLHQFLGTPAYMSPEQADMSGLDIDTRSDIYSLGVLLYQLLTGNTPFDPRELVESGLDAMRRIIRDRDPVRPSTRLVTLTADELTATAKRRSLEPPKLVHLLKGDLDWIVLKCLEKDRTRRFDTANGLASDLQRYLDHEPVTARPASRVYRLGKAIRRNRVAFAAAVLVLVSLTLGIAVSLWQAVRATRAGELALQRLAESEAILEFVTGVFQRPDPMRDGRSITVAETLDSAVKNLDSDLAGRPALRAKLQDVIGASYHSLGLEHEAISLQQKALDFLQTSSGPESPDTLQAMGRLANSFAGAGRPQEAVQLQGKVLELRRRVDGPEHTNTLSTMGSLAAAYHAAGRKKEALRLWEEVLDARRRILGPEHPATLSSMYNLAIAYFADGRKREALQLRQTVVRVRQKVLGPTNTATLTAMQTLALSVADDSRKDEALRMREEVLELSGKALGADHPNTLLAATDLAMSYHEVGRTNEALKLREDVLARRRKVNGSEHPETLRAMERLADSHRSARNYAQEIKLREEILMLRRKLRGREDPDTGRALADLSRAYSYKGGYLDQEVKLWEEEVQFRRQRRGPEHAETLGAMANLATCYSRGRQWTEALQLREQILALRRIVSGPEDPDTIESMGRLADSLAQSKRNEDAFRLREEVLALRRKVHGPEHSTTLDSMERVADSHHEAGRHDAELSLRKEVVRVRRKLRGADDLGGRESLYRLVHCYVRRATLQAWNQQEVEHVATCRELLDLAVGPRDSFTLEETAKVCSMLPNADPQQYAAALVLARRAVELDERRISYAQNHLTLGMAEYRNGNFSAADQAFVAVKGSDSISDERRVRLTRTAGFFRAMVLFRQGKDTDARKLFRDLAEDLPTWNDTISVTPADTLAGDRLLLRLIQREAKLLLEGGPEHQ